jgi:hydrogenase maturation protein HypF
LTNAGSAVLSQHLGDLADVRTYDDYRRNLAHLARLFDHAPAVLATDLHPQYRASMLARARASEEGLPVIEVQHHHAHVAACLAENGRPLEAGPVLGIALDGLGFGADGTIWGGEFLLADYRYARRMGTFKPVAMPGGTAASRQPWRNLYAHLIAEMSWAELTVNFEGLELYRDLAARPRAALDGMIAGGLNSPRASSCGRLFDAVAAALDICRDAQAYEGEAASRLEAIVCPRTLRDEDDALAYPFSIPNLPGSNLPYVEPLAMWRALLGDLLLATPPPVISARFHKGLAKAIVAMAIKLRRRVESGDVPLDTIALSGGCFQNAVLLEGVASRLRAEGFAVLTHRRVPANDGGIALGQAAVAAARSI